MKPTLAAGAAIAVLSLAAPTASSAATLSVINPRPCFGSGDTVNLAGRGYTPGAVVDFTRDGEPIPADPPILAGADGSVGADIEISKRSGQKRRTYAATDRANRVNTASVRVRVSELAVRIRPQRGRPNLPRRIEAVGFTRGSTTLWAHIRFRGTERTLKVGALRGPCRSLTRTKRLFGANPRFGRHLIHFDTRRRYRGKVAQRVSFSFRIFRSFAASSSATRRPPGQTGAGAAATAGAFANVSSPSAASTSTRSPAWNSPSSSFNASLSTSRFWITRFSGRAP
jgi:hypothetical protein